MDTPPGLWRRCFMGEKKAIKEMVDYNKQDIEVLDFVFERLYPFVPARVNYNLYGNELEACPGCGSHHVTKQGFKYTKANKYQQYRCSDCGTWFKSGRAEPKEAPVVR